MGGSDGVEILLKFFVEEATVETNRSRTVSCHIARSGAALMVAVIRKADRRKDGPNKVGCNLGL
jgi:hypothetical protein